MTDIKYLIGLSGKNFLFWLSRKIDYPLLPPDTVQINFTFNCNLRCKMCNMNEQMQFLQKQGRQVEIDSDTFKKVIKETKELGTKAILFIGGEPLVRKDLFDLVKYAKTLGLNTVIVTNATLLDEDNIEKCFNAGLDWLSISIDAASERIFSKIRGENVLNTITKNIASLNNLKDKQKRENPKITVVCTIMNDNLEELLDIVYLCKNLGAEKVLFQPIVANNIDQTQRDDIFSGFVPLERFHILDEAIDKLTKYKKSSLEDFDFIGNSINHLNLIKKYFRRKVKSLEYPCYGGYNRLQIVQEGKIYFCVSQSQYEANFGNIKESSLKDLWFSKRARFYRKLIRKCKFPCLQWCSYRDGFIELSGIWQKKIIFDN